MLGAISTALSGMLAAEKRVGVSANNVANALSSGSLDPGSPNQPYSAQTIVQTANNSGAGGVQAYVTTKSPAIVNAYAPDSPFANADGEIGVPNVDFAEEIVNAKIAEIAYKASASALRTASDMSDDLLKTMDESV